MRKKSKVKQVASRAKRNPRTGSNAPVELPGPSFLLTGPNAVDRAATLLVGENAERQLDAAVSEMGKGLSEGAEFSGSDFNANDPASKSAAIKRAKKVELKAEIMSVMATFRKDINGRLKSLSERIENQMTPLVRTVAEIAVAKKELEGRIDEFEDSLSAMLSLNDELEPIDIENMFSPHPELDEAMYAGSSKGEEPEATTILTEALQESHPDEEPEEASMFQKTI